MSEQPLVSVRGESILEVEPEIARLDVTVTARSPDRSRTLRMLEERAAAIGVIVAGFGDAIERTETERVLVGPQIKVRKAQERVSGYIGSFRQVLTIAAFDRLGEVIASLADQDLTEVAGPWWGLREDSAVHRRARMEAVRDALGRARDYAEAMGGVLTEVVEVADARLLSDRGPGPFAAAAVARSSSQAASPEELTFEIAPAKQVVRSSIEARFKMSSVDLRMPVAPRAAEETDVAGV